MKQRDKNRRKSAVFSLCVGEIALFTLQILCISVLQLVYSLPIFSH